MTEAYHFIGIGGIGMSGIARILIEQGKNITGSDCSCSRITQELTSLGARIYLGHNPSYVPSNATVIYSSDIKKDNPEYMFALEAGLNLMHRSDLLANLMKQSYTILVAGTHGKTTTSALLAHVFAQLNWSPTFAVGGICKNFETNAGTSTGKYFIAEADESDGSFLKYSSHAAIITNIDLDHLNHWKTETQLIEGFKNFASKVIDQDLLVWCYDDIRLSQLNLPGISYGFNQHATLVIKDFKQTETYSSFHLFEKEGKIEYITSPLMGKHNALNVAAVIALARALGAEWKDLKNAFMSFKGVGRRADWIGCSKQIDVFDDYGHHPTEIKATLEAFKEKFPSRRLVCIFQPHRFSRTKDCLEEFIDCFTDADVVVLTEIYPAGESPMDGIDGFSVYKKVQTHKKEEVYFFEKKSLIEFISNFAKPGDVVLTLGAGDITKYGSLLLQKLDAIEGI